MPETGYFAQKQRSPASLALVVLLHGALIAAVVLIKGPAFQRLVDPIGHVRRPRSAGRVGRLRT